METRNVADKARINLAKNMTDVDMAFLLKTLYQKNHSTYTHSINVAYLTSQICLQMAMDKNLAIQVVKGALLHDIGKIFTPTDILTKKRSLTEEEYQVIKRHTTDGVMIVKNMTPKLASEIVLDIIENHHERSDGSGYAKKKEVSFFAQLIHALDTYDAITADRVYHVAKPAEHGINTLIYEGIDRGIVNAIIECNTK